MSKTEKNRVIDGRKLLSTEGLTKHFRKGHVIKAVDELDFNIYEGKAHMGDVHGRLQWDQKQATLIRELQQGRNGMKLS